MTAVLAARATLFQFLVSTNFGTLSEKGLPLMHALSQAEMSYFSRLPIDRAETVLIGLSAISSHLELDSRDARQTISQLFIK